MRQLFVALVLAPLQGPLQDEAARAAELLPPDLQAGNGHKPYFEILVVTPAEPTPRVDWDTSAANLQAWLTDHVEDIVVITGFIASDREGLPTTLGRNGSDYSAAIFAGAGFGCTSAV